VASSACVLRWRAPRRIDAAPSPPEPPGSLAFRFAEISSGSPPVRPHSAAWVHLQQNPTLLHVPCPAGTTSARTGLFFCLTAGPRGARRLFLCPIETWASLWAATGPKHDQPRGPQKQRSDPEGCYPPYCARQAGHPQRDRNHPVEAVAHQLPENAVQSQRYEQGPGNAHGHDPNRDHRPCEKVCPLPVGRPRADSRGEDRTRRPCYPATIASHGTGVADEGLRRGEFIAGLGGAAAIEEPARAAE